MPDSAAPETAAPETAAPETAADRDAENRATHEAARRGVGVVVHVDEADPAKHEHVLRNVANLRADLGADVPVELVAHGPGLDLVLASSPRHEQLEQLISEGLRVDGCANTLRARGLGEDALVPGVRTVPAGISHLARRQFQGWAYVRP